MLVLGSKERNWIFTVVLHRAEKKPGFCTGLIRGSESASLNTGGDAIPSSAILSPSNVEGNRNLKKKAPAWRPGLSGWNIFVYL
jgi:hypothetical protein